MGIKKKWRSWPASLESVPRMRKTIQTEATRAGFDAKTAMMIGLVMEEIAVNIITYAYGDGSGKTIETAVEQKDHRFIIHVLDQGGAFDPLSVPDPDTDAVAADRPIGGLGLHMVKKIMNGMTYERRRGKNHLVLTKMIP